MNSTTNPTTLVRVTRETFVEVQTEEIDYWGLPTAANRALDKQCRDRSTPEGTTVKVEVVAK